MKTKSYTTLLRLWVTSSYRSISIYYITEVVGTSRYRNTARLLKRYMKFLGNTRNLELGGGGVFYLFETKCLYDHVILLEIT